MCKRSSNNNTNRLVKNLFLTFHRLNLLFPSTRTIITTTKGSDKSTINLIEKDRFCEIGTLIQNSKRFFVDSGEGFADSVPDKCIRLKSLCDIRLKYKNYK